MVCVMRGIVDPFKGHDIPQYLCDNTIILNYFNILGVVYRRGTLEKKIIESNT